MRSLGVRHFRMSIAWPRVLPNGTGSVNQAGLDFYLTLVEALQAAGIQPHVTLCGPFFLFLYPTTCRGFCCRRCKHLGPA